MVHLICIFPTTNLDSVYKYTHTSHLHTSKSIATICIYIFMSNLAINELPFMIPSTYARYTEILGHIDTQTPSHYFL